MMTVSDIMTRDVVTVRNSAPILDAIDLMRRYEIHALIVEKSHELDAYGMVSVQDIVGRIIASGLNPKQVRVFEIMAKPCIVLNPNLAIEYAAQLLSKAHLHSAPVIQGELLGIVSITDILSRGNALEQPQELELRQRIEDLSHKAHQICGDMGPSSQQCAQAWSKVDALQGELAYQHSLSLDETASEIFWANYPEAFKNSEYDAWCGG